jgi:hypothetical protein
VLAIVWLKHIGILVYSQAPYILRSRGNWSRSTMEQGYSQLLLLPWGSNYSGFVESVVHLYGLSYFQLLLKSIAKFVILMVYLDNITFHSYPIFFCALLLIAFIIILWNLALQLIYSMCLCYPLVFIIPFYNVHSISTIYDLLCDPLMYWESYGPTFMYGRNNMFNLNPREAMLIYLTFVLITVYSVRRIKYGIL